jgi:hypothetical protein
MPGAFAEAGGAPDGAPEAFFNAPGPGGGVLADGSFAGGTFARATLGEPTGDAVHQFECETWEKNSEGKNGKKKVTKKGSMDKKRITRECKIKSCLFLPRRACKQSNK